MDTAFSNINITEIPNDPKSLMAAFQVFTKASRSLQQKYDKLAKETQALREELALKDEEIKRSERLAMLGKTAAGIAHEVRNPLGAIKLFLSLLKEDLKDMPNSLELAEQIEKSANALDDVVSNILHFAKSSKPLLAPINMHLLLKEQIEEIKTTKQSQAQFNLSLSGNPFISGHESSLKQVINNLVINALQATNDSGVITIDYHDSPHGSAELKISDNGNGIPEEMLDKIFEPFISNKKDGTGLGLAIVKRILEQHEADITVTNCLGACFTITFPRQAQETSRCN